MARVPKTPDENATTANSGTTTAILWGDYCDCAGLAFVSAMGTFDGATVVLQFSVDGGTTWATAVDHEGGAAVSLTANGGRWVKLPRGASAQWSWGTGSGGVDLDLHICVDIV